MKGGRSENIPGRKDASTEYNYARDALEELWGGEGVIRTVTLETYINLTPDTIVKSLENQNLPFFRLPSSRLRLEN